MNILRFAGVSFAAARAMFAGDVVREASLWRAIEADGTDLEDLRAHVRSDLERLFAETEQAGHDAA